MLILGTLIIILSTFNLKTIKEIKEIYRIGIILLIQIIIILYDSIHLDFINNGISIYNDIFIITSYTKLIELLIFIMAIVYFYIIKEEGHAFAHFKSQIQGVKTFGFSKAKDLIILILLNILGIILFIQWNNIILIFLTLELQSYTLYLITTIYNKSYNSTKSGLLYFLLGSVGSIFVLFGLILIYNETGLMNMNDIYIMLSSAQGWNPQIQNPMAEAFGFKSIGFAYLFILFGLFFKIGTAPFHNWLISIYSNTPTIITIWISIIGKISILTVIYTLISNSSFEASSFNNSTDLAIGLKSIGFASDGVTQDEIWTSPISSNGFDLSQILGFLAIISILSIIFGAIGGLGQFTIKRIIGYSGLVNSGYFIYIILSNNNTTLSTYLFNIYQYSLTHIVWFILILINGLYYHNKIIGKAESTPLKGFAPQEFRDKSLPISSNYTIYEFVKDFYGYIFINPYLGLSYIIILSSLIGIPPLTGFYAKYYVLLTGIISSEANGFFIAILVLLSSAFTAYYYIFIIKNIIITGSLDTKSKAIGYLINQNGFSSRVKTMSSSLTPLLSIIVSIIIMFILCITIGLDIANNGTHIVESYYINKYV